VNVAYVKRVSQTETSKCSLKRGVIVRDKRRLELPTPYTNKYWNDFTFGGQGHGHDSAASPAPTREQVLKEAEKLINGNRHEDYGSALENHERIAKMWEVILGNERITPSQVALCMGALKIARLAHDQSKTDSWIDLAGYAALGGEMMGAK
jgi:hypothetical protein